MPASLSDCPFRPTVRSVLTCSTSSRSCVFSLVVVLRATTSYLAAISRSLAGVRSALTFSTSRRSSVCSAAGARHHVGRRAVLLALCTVIVREGWRDDEPRLLALPRATALQRSQTSRRSSRAHSPPAAASPPILCRLLKQQVLILRAKLSFHSVASRSAGAWRRDCVPGAVCVAASRGLADLVLKSAHVQ